MRARSADFPCAPRRAGVPLSSWLFVARRSFPPPPPAGRPPGASPPRPLARRARFPLACARARARAAPLARLAQLLRRAFRALAYLPHASGGCDTMPASRRSGCPRTRGPFFFLVAGAPAPRPLAGPPARSSRRGPPPRLASCRSAPSYWRAAPPSMAAEVKTTPRLPDSLGSPDARARLLFFDPGSANSLPPLRRDSVSRARA